MPRLHSTGTEGSDWSGAVKGAQMVKFIRHDEKFLHARTHTCMLVWMDACMCANENINYIGI